MGIGRPIPAVITYGSAIWIARYPGRHCPDMEGFPRSRSDQCALTRVSMRMSPADGT